VTINVPDRGPGEAVVKVQICGVCHTDLHYREGGIKNEFPFLLGHEAAGVVEAVKAAGARRSQRCRAPSRHLRRDCVGQSQPVLRAIRGVSEPRLAESHE
jgi:threonine dehydrogenase-like Zn-dependent dehydrogenase